MAETAWEAAAWKKRQAILSAIPEPWRLKEPIPPPDQQRDITGAYIQQFMSKKEIIITETDAIGILEQTTTGKWSAYEVTQAFCHRAAVAHQMVSKFDFTRIGKEQNLGAHSFCARSTVYMTYLSIRLWSTPVHLMLTIDTTIGQSDHCTDCQSA